MKGKSAKRSPIIRAAAWAICHARPWNLCWLIHNYSVIPALAMRCEAEHCEGKTLPPRRRGNPFAEGIARAPIGCPPPSRGQALPEPWSRFARHGSPGMTRVVNHTSTKVGTNVVDLKFLRFSWHSQSGVETEIRPERCPNLL